VLIGNLTTYLQALISDLTPTALPTLSPTTTPTAAPTEVPTSSPTVFPCSLVNISGWEDNSFNGNDIISVTLGGLSATIVRTFTNYLLIVSPFGFPLTRTSENLVVVTTITGRVITLTKPLTYVPRTYVDFENFQSQTLPVGIWSNAGTIPWSFSDPYGQDTTQSALWKDGGLGDDQSYFVDLQWTVGCSSLTSQGGCFSIATRIKFAYKAYSSDVSCYDKFQLLIQQNNQPNWTVIWNGQIGDLTDVNPWFYEDIVLPCRTTGLSIYVNSGNVFDGCRFFSPGEDHISHCYRWNYLILSFVFLPFLLSGNYESYHSSSGFLFFSNL
jgi:hypothetical protein